MDKRRLRIVTDNGAEVPNRGTPSEAGGSVSQALSERVSILQRMEIPVWVFDIDHSRVIWGNARAVELWGASDLTELCARDMAVDMSPTVRRRLKQYQEDFGRGLSFTESWTLHPMGSPRTINCVFSGIELEDGRMAMLSQAVSEQLQDSQTLRSLQALLHASVMISLYDSAGRLLYCNPAARADIGSDCDSLQDRFLEPHYYTDLCSEVEVHGECCVERQVKSTRGLRWHELDVRHGSDPITGAPTLLISEIDVTERKRAELRAHHLAFHDTLTNLPNRNLLKEQMQVELARASRDEHRVALMFIDLDRFKTINDSLGHSVGDLLLVEVGNRLRDCVYDVDTVARLGGDEFVVVLNGLSEPHAAGKVAQRVLDALAERFVVGGHELHISASIGISLAPDDGDTMAELMKNADLAMYEAKDTGRNAFRFYKPNMNVQAIERLSLENELRRAIANEEFELYYQPRVSIDDNRVIGAEALIRWRHPERGIVSPDVFITVAEETGMIEAIGRWVLRRAAAQQVAWQRQGFRLRVAVNLSTRQFVGNNLLQTVRNAIDDTGINPSCLELEITESMLMGNADHLIATLEDLNAMGIKLAIDDFGTGYSNLAYLQKYPVHSLKIDRSFINDVKNGAIPEMVIAMGRLMQLTVVAEGVEHEDQLEWLRAHGCDEYQGYYFSRPLPVPALTELLTQFSGLELAQQ